MTPRQSHKSHRRSRQAASVLALVAAIATVVGCQVPRSPAPANDAAPPDALTWMVLNELNSIGFDRAEPLNRPPLVTEVPGGMIQAINVSPDGKPDWLIDYSGQGGQWCGTGGCLRTLYISDGEDYVMAFNNQVDTLAVQDDAGQPVVGVQVHELNCSEGTAECRFTYVWDAAQQQLVALPRSSANHGGFKPLPEPAASQANAGQD